MTALQAVALYSAIHLLLLVALAYLVASRRGQTRVGIGHGDDEALHRAIRVHGNATEYLPGALVGLLLIALLGASTLVIHALGVALTLGRALHAYGLSSSSGTSFGRVTGASLTLLVYIAEAGVLFWLAIQ